MKMKIIVKFIGNENVKKKLYIYTPGRKSRGVKEVNIGLLSKYYLLLYPNKVCLFYTKKIYFVSFRSGL